jgi:hypothetical protein
MVYYDKLKDFLELKLGLAYYNGPKSELVTYCPYCERGSTRSHGHCYIKVTSTDEMPTFFCFKCSETEGKGTLAKLLKNLGANPKDFITEETFCTVLTKTRDYQNKDFEKYEYSRKEISSDSYKLKRQYLHSRLGFDYDLEKVDGLVLNIRDFVYDNKIELDETSLKFLDYFEDSFVGFLLTRGTKLILRNIDPSSEFRYFKIDLIKNPLFNDFYGVKCGQIKRDTNTIILCEGIFDLFGGLKLLELEEVKNNSCYFAAILGNYYAKIVPSVLDYCKLTFCNVVVLSDSNIKESSYYWLKQNPMVNNLELYWNKAGKDFGEGTVLLTKTVFTNNYRRR